MQELDARLDLCREETKLVVGRTSPAVDDLRTALADDPKLRAEAEALIAGTSDLEPRDHLTRWRNVLLRIALAPEGAP